MQFRRGLNREARGTRLLPVCHPACACQPTAGTKGPPPGLLRCPALQELGVYGRLRKVSRCGPLSMFR